jgi:hypothetical protein
MAETDNQDEVRVKSSFTLWKGSSGHPAQIQAEMMVYDYANEGAGTSSTQANQLTSVETGIINLGDNGHTERPHITQMRVEIITGTTKRYATAKALTETSDPDQLDGETCYVLYQGMKKILGEIGFGEAVWPYEIPTDWRLIDREMLENGDVRWIQAGDRRYRIASQHFTADEGDHESEATRYTGRRGEPKTTNTRGRNDGERAIERNGKRRNGDHTRNAKKWIKPGRARKEVI